MCLPACLLRWFALTLADVHQLVRTSSLAACLLGRKQGKNDGGRERDQSRSVRQDMYRTLQDGMKTRARTILDWAADRPWVAPRGGCLLLGAAGGLSSHRQQQAARCVSCLIPTSYPTMHDARLDFGSCLASYYRRQAARRRHRAVHVAKSNKASALPAALSRAAVTVTSHLE